MPIAGPTAGPVGGISSPEKKKLAIDVETRSISSSAEGLWRASLSSFLREIITAS